MFCIETLELVILKQTRKSPEAMNAPQRKNLQSNTTCTPRHEKENNIFWFFLRTDVKCKTGIWFVSSAHPLINIYVCTKFHFKTFCTYQDMVQTGIHYKTKWLSGDNSIHIRGRIMVNGHCPSPHCHLSKYQVLFKCQQ